MPRIVLHAPNVHVGGGKTLLEGLLAELVRQGADALVIHDRRLALPAAHPRLVGRAIAPRILSRLRAEWLLYRLVRPSDVVVCFGNLPPLFRLPARTSLYLQNRLLVSPWSFIDRRDLRMRLLVGMERLWLKSFKSHVDTIYVQTPSMARAVHDHLGAEREVVVKPFFDRPHAAEVHPPEPEARPFDFIYPSSGYFHKNHKVLVAAWSLLKQRGLAPSLALTLTPRWHPQLIDWIERKARDEGLDIVNLGDLSLDELAAAYRRSRALIFPSKLESLGLPLVEASALGLPILAAELDYVRDVVEPVEAFDPDSAISIARAVERFSGLRHRQVVIDDSKGFLREVASRAPGHGRDLAVHEDAAP